jgi:hypothetical protein
VSMPPTARPIDKRRQLVEFMSLFPPLTLLPDAYDAIGRHLALSGYGALAPASSPKVVSSQQQDILSVDLLASVCSLVDRPELGKVGRIARSGR